MVRAVGRAASVLWWGPDTPVLEGVIKEAFLEEVSIELRSEGQIGVIRVRNGGKNLLGRETAYAKALRWPKAPSVPRTEREQVWMDQKMLGEKSVRWITKVRPLPG